MYICMYVRTYVRTYVCVCVYLYTHIYVCAHTQTKVARELERGQEELRRVEERAAAQELEHAARLEVAQKEAAASKAAVQSLTAHLQGVELRLGEAYKEVEEEAAARLRAEDALDGLHAAVLAQEKQEGGDAVMQGPSVDVYDHTCVCVCVCVCV